MSNLEIAKKIIKRNYNYANCGIFSTMNIVGDPMEELYNENGLSIDICFEWAYFEVFGLSESEFEELEEYYHSLAKDSRF